ncbi:MAG TPA: alpha/beta fold hydrolase [Burkholderiales bacterium]|nr:alpha/beta fold hydrolase [Burkholderiales bacterium]
MEQTIRFLKTADGVRLAYAVSGSGPPLVKAANWLSHLEFDWQSPVWRHWFGYLSRSRQLVRYDPRGCGLSDWDVADLGLPAQVADLEAVIDAVGIQCFPLLGISQGGAICIEYAVRHPERVSHLVLYGAYSRGRARRSDEAMRESAALVELIRVGWGQENPAFRRLFASLFIPDANEEQVRWFSDLMRTTTRPEIASRIVGTFGQIDVRDRLAQVRCPTLVVHARGDARAPFEEGRELATGISGAQFVALESRNHILIESEPAWARFKQVVDEFLGAGGASAGDSSAAAEGFEDLTRREADILRLVAQGLSNGDIARRLFISEKTVRNHLTSIFDKLGVDSRARAIVFARDRGLGG